MSNHRLFDTIIVGGGPAGLSAALELANAQVECLVLERENTSGGQLHQIKSEITDFAAGYFKDGSVLARNLADLSSRVNLKVALGRTVERFDLSAKKIYTNGEEYKAKTILLATGNRLKRLDVPGASTFSEDIFYKSYDAPQTFSKMRVAVVGGGDNAAIKALELATAAEQVYLIHRSDNWKARPDLVREIKSNNRIEVFEHTEVDTISGSSRSINSLHLTSKQTKRVRNITIDKLFVKIGYAPNTEPFKDQVECDKEGYVIVNKDGATSVPSVFAAGDIISGGLPRIPSAMGTGALAARGVISQLVNVPAAIET
jgi:thioredoxin reductase (NADPH)